MGDGTMSDIDPTDPVHLAACLDHARTTLGVVADEFNRQLVNREVKCRPVARELGIDAVKLHHFSRGRMILTDDEAQRVIAWMTQR